MNLKSRTLFIILIILVTLVVAGTLRVYGPIHQNVDTNKVSSFSYSCDEGKTIEATYYQGENKPSPNKDMPPTPSGSVSFKLSDGRQITLMQTISADGVRYANTDDSIIFWSKGRGVLFIENEKQNYTGCIEVVKNPGNLPKVYSNSIKGFSVRYGEGYTVDENYEYQEMGPGKEIKGVKFTIPKKYKDETNLSSDSYISIEQVDRADSCTANIFVYDKNTLVNTINEKGVTYSVTMTSGAGAGNRYEETVYAIPGTNPCIAVRYFVHYSAIENYPAGTVKSFDKNALINEFDSIRNTLSILK